MCPKTPVYNTAHYDIFFNQNNQHLSHTSLFASPQRLCFSACTSCLSCSLCSSAPLSPSFFNLLLQNANISFNLNNFSIFRIAQILTTSCNSFHFLLIYPDTHLSFTGELNLNSNQVGALPNFELIYAELVRQDRTWKA